MNRLVGHQNIFYKNNGFERKAEQKPFSIGKYVNGLKQGTINYAGHLHFYKRYTGEDYCFKKKHNQPNLFSLEKFTHFIRGLGKVPGNLDTVLDAFVEKRRNATNCCYRRAKANWK